MKQRSFLTLLMFALMTVVLAACSGGGSNESAKDPADRTPVEGGDLVVAVLSDAQSLDPASTNDASSSAVQANIFERLIVRNSDNELAPSLAESWESIDENTWEFKLREGVKFHDGTDFNAEAVKINLERILDPEVASPRYFLFQMIDEITVIDEYTVQIKTEYPFSPLLAHLSHTGSGMVSPAVIAEDYEAMKAGKIAGTIINDKPIGTGFFTFESWTPDDRIKLVRNEDYWGDKPHVDTVTFQVSPESATRNADLERGFVQIADPVQPIEVNSINESNFGSVFQKPSSGLSYIGFNMNKKPFDDKRVRQAITMMVNRAEIIDGIYEGFGIPAVGPLAPGIFGYDDSLEPIEYDVEKAKQLLAEAGYADGFKTTIWTNDSDQRTDTAIMLQHALKEVNIDVDIEQLEWGAYLAKTAAGEHDMFIHGWSNPPGDADYGLYALFNSAQHGDAGNRSFYNNPEVDALLDEGRREADPEKRMAIYKEIQEILIDDAPLIFVHHQEYLVGLSNDIIGFDMDTSGIYNLQNVQFVE